ncbi:MAG: sigma-70 family RNA polymerase sigma factor [Deltaproteobacteria bacterium]|nr:sigma-70 family RNA polymerase sigma factor [Deltaproteobacteria bacterium]
MTERVVLPPLDLPLPGTFDGPALAPGDFVHELDRSVRAELDRLLSALDDAPGRTAASPDPEVAAAMTEATARASAALTGGHGFILIRGVPVHGHSRAALATLYASMGRALGRPVPQNLDGELITDIRDTGEDPGDPEVRLYRTRAEQDFHTDGADVIGLLCLATAARGGASRVVSSVRVFEAVRAARPDLVPLLFAPWFFHLPGARARGLPEALPRPIARFDGRKLETFFIPWYIRRAQGLPGVPDLDVARGDLLALYEATANDPALYLDMTFEPGDVQWLRNAFILHKRTAYEDPAPPAPPRHLLRLWLVRVHDGVDALQDDTRFVAWLHRVARNVIIDHHRRVARQDAKHEAFVAEWRDEDEERNDGETSLAVFVRAFIEALPSPYREALRLTELEGLTMREAAVREGLSIPGMKSRVQRGRRLLRELFEACCEIALDARGVVMDYTPRQR